MKVTYDPGVDVLRIVFSNVPIEESNEEKPGVILDVRLFKPRAVKLSATRKLPSMRC